MGAEAAAASPTELHARLSYGTIDMLKLASETRATRPVHHRITQQCMVDGRRLRINVLDSRSFCN